MSPEQTGRMNRSLDYRSDLYRLARRCTSLRPAFPFHPPIRSSWFTVTLPHSACTFGDRNPGGRVRCLRSF